MCSVIIGNEGYRYMRNLRSTYINVALLVLSLLIFLAAAEIAARFYFYRVMSPLDRNVFQFVLHGATESTKQLVPIIRPYLWSNYEPNPSSEQVNQYGWRYGGGTKKGTIRILCLGGSTTWSLGASHPTKSYPAQMEKYLQDKGFSVDVVNGGCPYFTTAEMIGTLAFKGIYTQPDIVLIHEGGNDSHPLSSPRDYRPDYSHWRTADRSAHDSSRLDLFRLVCKVPLYATRVIAWKLLRPNPFQGQTLGIQTDSPQDALIATNDITGRTNTGYRSNLMTLSAITRAHGAKPVFITFNQPKGKLWHLYPPMKNDTALATRVETRAHWAIDHNNNIMLETGKNLNIPVIPFHAWHPSKDKLWIDQCHLNDEGCREKGMYVGQWLVDHGYLDGANKLKPNVRLDRQ
jgi:lysophospholipase L1-like esterase